MTINTVDKLLLKIVNFTTPTIEEKISKKDSQVLRSLATSISSHFFITENQSRLLIKILKDNSKKINDFSEEIDETLSAPMWSRKFRQIEQVKKMYIAPGEDGDPCIIIDFTFSSQIRKIMQDVARHAENLVIIANGKKYSAELTEQNVILLINALDGENFDIDEKLKNHYLTIKSWSETEIRNQFLITNIAHQNFQRAITADLGLSTTIDQSIINDRSMRYQYLTENPKNPGENLVEHIANRSKTKVWIDRNEHTLAEIISALKQLRRLPVLVVFDQYDETRTFDHLKLLSESLEKNEIFHDIGIYFRLPNTEQGKQFNKFIADKKYNNQLDQTTQVVGVQSGKIPKFFLSNLWKPMSVIALDTRMGLRHGKTAVYSNCCDLIIEYAEQPTLIEQTKIGTWRQN